MLQPSSKISRITDMGNHRCPDCEETHWHGANLTIKFNQGSRLHSLQYPRRHHITLKRLTTRGQNGSAITGCFNLQHRSFLVESWQLDHPLPNAALVPGAAPAIAGMVAARCNSGRVGAGAGGEVGSAAERGFPSSVGGSGGRVILGAGGPHLRLHRLHRPTGRAVLLPPGPPASCATGGA